MGAKRQHPGRRPILEIKALPSIGIFLAFLSGGSGAFSPSLSSVLSSSTRHVRRRATTTPSPDRRLRSAAGSDIADPNVALADEARRIALARCRGRPPLSPTDPGPATVRRDVHVPRTHNDRAFEFFDTAHVHVAGGKGGNGCVAFRRERGEPMGGPNGGRGGPGGAVIFRADESLNTLAGLRNQVHVKGENGGNGIGKNKNGRAGADAVVRVPCGTIVRELHTQKVAGELRTHGQDLVVAPAGRGGRGNAALMTSRRTAPRMAERGEPGTARWLAVELRLLADVGFLGMPNAGKSTLLSSASGARPKIADYPFTTIVPNLGVCDLGEESAGLVLCDIPGLVEGAAAGVGLGLAFLRHVRRCQVLLHVVDGTRADPVGDFAALNRELAAFDEALGQKPQVVVLNKIDVSEVRAHEEELIARLRAAAGHSRVMTISAATAENVRELMGRLKKFVDAEKEKKKAEGVLKEEDMLLAEVDLSKAPLDSDSDDYEIMSDPAYPGQWRIKGTYIEQVAKMTHWEYPEAVERFGRQLQALGIEDELLARGAAENDLVMIDEYDFDFAPGKTNPYIPAELLEMDSFYEAQREDNDGKEGGKQRSENDGKEEDAWRPFNEGGFMDMDKDEIIEFKDDGGWDLLEDDFNLSPNMLDGDDVWMS